MAESGVTKPFDSAHGGVLGAGFSLGLQQTKSITSCYEACFQGFRRLISVLGGGAAANVLSQSTEELQQRLETVHEQLGRFKMWAGNAGAHRSGKMSLDYRLREALHVHRQVVRLLEDLEHALEEAIRIITNPTPASEQNVETSPTVCSSDSSSDDAATECDPTDALSDDEGLSSVTDLEYAILDIAHVLKCLYRFSVVLHQPIPAERIQKCASIDVKHYEVWDIAHAVDKFRNAPEFLQQRLGRANTKRRQLFIYHEKHHQKITQFIDATPGPPVPEQPLATAPVGVTQMVMQPLKSTPGPGTAILSETTATAFHAMNNIVLKALPDDHESDTGQSQTSYASSYAGHSGLTSYRLSVPAPPIAEENGFDDEPFECPYCHDMVSIQNSKAWKRHVFSDLMPYVCTFKYCPNPDHLYGSRQEWFEHESQMHRREWHCETCDLTFYEKEAMIEHLREAHKDELPESECASVAEWCERARTSKESCPLCPLNFPPTQEHLKQFHRNDIEGTIALSAEAERLLKSDEPSCPYCPVKYEPTQLRRHIGHHLQQLALFILHRPMKDDLYDDEIDLESQRDLREDSSLSEIGSRTEVLIDNLDVADENLQLWQQAEVEKEAWFSEKARKAEEARLAEESRLAEEAGLAEERRLAEEARIAEQQLTEIEAARVGAETRGIEEQRRALYNKRVKEESIAEQKRLAQEEAERREGKARLEQERTLKLELEWVTREKEEAERREAIRFEAERREQERLEQERLAELQAAARRQKESREMEENKAAEARKIEQELLERERLKRIAREKEAAERREQERIAYERGMEEERRRIAEARRIVEAQEAERREQERIARERKVEEERLARLELERERSERERIDNEYREAGRRKQERIEAERQRQERERLEMERRAEMERIAEARRLEQEEQERREQARIIAEEARLAESARLFAIEQARIAAEEARTAEEKRIAEECRIAEARRLEEEARLAEERRLAAEADARRIEQARIAAELEAKRIEEERAKEAQLAEERRLAEEARIAEKGRLASEVEARRIEEARIAAELEAKRIEEESKGVTTRRERRLAEEARIAEKARLAAEAEARRIVEARIAAELEAKRIEGERRAAEEARIAEERRLGEERRLATIEAARVAEEARSAETRQLAEERRLAAKAEARRLEEERRLERARLAEKAKRIEEERRVEEALTERRP